MRKNVLKRIYCKWHVNHCTIQVVSNIIRHWGVLWEHMTDISQCSPLQTKQFLLPVMRIKTSLCGNTWRGINCCIHTLTVLKWLALWSPYHIFWTSNALNKLSEQRIGTHTLYIHVWMALYKYTHTYVHTHVRVYPRVSFVYVPTYTCAMHNCIISYHTHIHTHVQLSSYKHSCACLYKPRHHTTVPDHVCILAAVNECHKCIPVWGLANTLHHYLTL